MALEAADRAGIVARGVGLRTDYERDSPIHEVFRARAAATPGAVAVTSASGSLDYARLEHEANQLAHRLRELGVRPGTCVGMAFERSLDVPVAMLAILKAGAAYVPLDTSYPRERLAFMLEDTAVELVVGDNANLEALAGLRPKLVSTSVEAAAIARMPVEPPEVCVRADDRAYVMYTSGSTGRPKGVEVLHRGVVRLVRMQDYVTVRPDDVFLQFAPLAFDASTFEIWGALLNGAKLAMAPAGPLSLSELAETLARHAVTTLWLTAPLFRLMVETELQSFGGLRRLLTGGDVVTAEHAARFMQAFPGCKLIDGYGPTENTTFSCCYEIPSLETIRGGVPIGRPIANSNAYVLDAQLEPVPFGVPGELCVGGDGLARGYRNLPELTAERFVPDPFSAIPGARMYKTGDLARLRPEGVLEFLGRADHQVKINGHRVEIGEVEASLRAHPAVSASVVSVVEHRGEHVLLAHVTCVRNERTDERSLRKHLLTKLPRYMIPTRIAVIERLSEHNSGKIDRVAMAERAAQLLSGSNRPFQGMGGT